MMVKIFDNSVNRKVLYNQSQNTVVQWIERPQGNKGAPVKRLLNIWGLWNLQGTPLSRGLLLLQYTSFEGLPTRTIIYSIHWQILAQQDVTRIQKLTSICLWSWQLLPLVKHCIPGIISPGNQDQGLKSPEKVPLPRLSHQLHCPLFLRIWETNEPLNKRLYPK